MTFVEICQQLGIECRESGHEHCRKGWVQLDCPFCVQPGHFRLGYNIRYNYANCWQCGPINLLTALQTLTNGPVANIIGLLKEIDRDPSAFKEELRPTGIYNPPSPRVDTAPPIHRKYLEGRGFDPYELERLWKIQYLTIGTGKYNWRVFIPIHYSGREVSWTTRAIVDSGLRYVSAAPQRERINHKTLLYGEDYARHAIVIVEGPTDVWRIGPGAVCTFGTGYKLPQVAKMVKYPVRVVCFDAEKAAQDRAKALCDKLEIFDGETYRVELKAKDPGSASEKEIKELRRRFLE